MGAKIAVVGIGAIGILHAHAVNESTRADLVALAHPHAGALRTAADQLGVKHRFSSLEGLLESGVALDAVVLATPGKLHQHHVEAVVEAGKHCLVEKPLSLHFAGAQRLAAAAKEAGVVLQVGHLLRFDDEYQRMKNAVSDRTTGDPDVITARRFFAPVATHRPLHLAYDALTHDIDQALWLTGSTCAANTVEGRTYDGVTSIFLLASFRLTQGTFVVLQAGWGSLLASQPDVSNEVGSALEIFGTERRLRLDLDDVVRGPQHRSEWFSGLIALQLDEFLRRVQGEHGELLSSLNDAVEGIRIAETIARIDSGSASL